MNNFANRIKKISPSPTLAISAKTKKLKSEGKDVVNFGTGEPDFDTPEFIKQKAIEAIKSGFTKYTPTTGITELKEIISEKFRKDNNNIPFVSIEYDGFQDSTREIRIDTFVAQVKERYENKKYTKSH